MREFFRGWKRKVGCVTLMIVACLTVGWVRSLIVSDGVEIVTRHDKFGGWSEKGAFGYFHCHAAQARVVSSDVRFYSIEINDTQTETVDDTAHEIDLALGSLYLKSRKELWGHYSDLVQTAGPAVECRVLGIQIPYWFPTIPLILLSAYLLLGKPNPLKPTVESQV